MERNADFTVLPFFRYEVVVGRVVCGGGGVIAVENFCQAAESGLPNSQKMPGPDLIQREFRVNEVEDDADHLQFVSDLRIGKIFIAAMKCGGGHEGRSLEPH
jgi:hypothetical protein